MDFLGNQFRHFEECRFPASLVSIQAGVVHGESMNLVHHFWNQLSHDADRLLFEYLAPSGEVTWRQTRGELLTEASLWMAALRGADIQPGDRVALSLGKSTGLVTAHLAILGVGAGVVPLNPALSAVETEAVLKQAEVKLAITTAPTVSRAPEIIKAVNGPWWVAAPHEDAHHGDALPQHTVALASVLAGHHTGAEPYIGADDDVALLLFTSGTTGQPKGVGLTHRNIGSNLQALLVDTWRMNAPDRLLHALPPHHLHGLGLGLYGTLYVGNTAVLLDRFDPVGVLTALARQRISVFMGVPTMYHRMTERMPELAGDVSYASMRLFISGSAPLSPETFRRFEEQSGFRIVERYGLTETAINTSNPLDAERRPGTVGRALPGIEVGIFDPQTQQQLSPGETGEIWVRGPNVFSGYWNNPAATAAAFHADWFRTGDLGVLSADDYLSINGRMKELIIVGGTNVTPGEVEAVLETEAGVRECAVAGVPDADLGEKVAAFIVPQDGQDAAALEARLRKRLEQDLAPYKRPRLYRFLTEIPRNAMGKVERAKLKDLGAEAQEN